MPSSRDSFRRNRVAPFPALYAMGRRCAWGAHVSTNMSAHGGRRAYARPLATRATETSARTLNHRSNRAGTALAPTWSRAVRISVDNAFARSR